MTGQSLWSLPLSMYKVIAAYKPEDTKIAKVWECYSTPSTPDSYAYDMGVISLFFI